MRWPAPCVLSLGLASALACGDDAAGGQDGGTQSNADAAPPPQALCDAPEPADVSTPTTTVGDGTAQSCTEAALRSAALLGGTIVFDCGSDPVTITVSEAIVFAMESVLDGGDLVTLSGGDSSRILYLDSD